jgi:hypothetical protein
MSFEIIEPGTNPIADPLPSGCCSIGAGGVLAAWQADLDLVAIRDRAVVLVDRDNSRIALRACRDGEPGFRIAPVMRKREPRDTGRRTLAIYRALRACGVKLTADAAGRYEWTVKGEGASGLLIVNLSAKLPRVRDDAQLRSVGIELPARPGSRNGQKYETAAKTPEK